MRRKKSLTLKINIHAPGQILNHQTLESTGSSFMEFSPRKRIQWLRPSVLQSRKVSLRPNQLGGGFLIFNTRQVRNTSVPWGPFRWLLYRHAPSKIPRRHAPLWLSLPCSIESRGGEHLLRPRTCHLSFKVLNLSKVWIVVPQNKGEFVMSANEHLYKFAFVQLKIK
jgi:hypothetical protein